jgi:hypothetical protein
MLAFKNIIHIVTRSLYRCTIFWLELSDIYFLRENRPDEFVSKILVGGGRECK